jgi:hypothetical protein
MTIEEAPDRAGRKRRAVLAAEQRGQFDQRDVHLRLDRSQDHVAVGLNVMRAQIAALRQGRPPTFGAPGANPTDGTRNRDAETLCRRVARQAAVNGSDYTVAKILR